jgi:hypothetical protein
VKRNQKCYDSAAGLPGGLNIDSCIKTAQRECMIGPAGQASHLIEINNRTLLRFEVEIFARCESSGIYYPGNESTWEKKLQISPRPLRGGPRKRQASQDLESSEDATDDSIKVLIKYEAVGCRCIGTSEIELLVDAES